MSTLRKADRNQMGITLSSEPELRRTVHLAEDDFGGKAVAGN